MIDPLLCGQGTVITAAGAHTQLGCESSGVYYLFALTARLRRRRGLGFNGNGFFYFQHSDLVFRKPQRNGR